MLDVERFEHLIQSDIDALRSCAPGVTCDGCTETLCVKLAAVADFPSDYGHFRILGFVNNKDAKDHVIVVKGEIGDGEDLLCRIHSACLTGDAFGSRRCDCGPQLHEALSVIEREGRGLLLYQQAEGRGIGLTNKLRAYALQDTGLDTLDANESLGFLADEREYDVPAEMLNKIGVKSIRLLTNNPEKVAKLEALGVRILSRVPLQSSTHKDNEQYLKTKKERFGHLLHF